MKYPAQDKLLHFIAGQFIYAITYYFSYDPKLSIGWVIGCGIAKEIVDHCSPRHEASFFDFLYTVLGGVYLFLYVSIL